MNTLKNYLFESLIVLSVLIGLGIFYFRFMATESFIVEHNKVPERVVSEIIIPLAAEINPTKLNTAPVDMLSVEPEVILRLDGSNTIGSQLAPALAAAYLQQLGADAILKKPLTHENEVQVIGYLPEHNKVVAIEIKAHGSSTGFKSLIAKKTDIAMSSRNIKDSENLKLLLSHGDMTKPKSEHIIALDGLAIITHPKIEIESMTVEQLSKIFSGEIDNWSQLNGPDQAIHLYARDDQSGTYDTFKSLVLDKFSKKLASAKRFESNADLAAAVEQDPSGIGFTGLAYAKAAMIVRVAAAPGLPAVQPKQFSISSEDYPLSRRLFLYANKVKTDNIHITDFINFAISTAGQYTVEQVSFIPQKITSILPPVSHDYPAKYQQLALNGERLSVTFRMRADRAEIDNKSAQDIEHLVDYLRNNPYEKIALIGFSADESDDEGDRTRSFIRSQLLAYELKQRGIRNIEIIALGNQIPIDSNLHELGRYRNNRTEIWLIKTINQSLSGV